MTTRKPKPVRAWAILDEKGRLSPVIVSSERRFLRELCFSDRGDYIARVTIAPDGTPSQAAEVRKLRRLLRIALCAAENYIAAMEPHEGECDEPEDQAVIWHARKHVAEVKAALRGRRGAK